MGTPLFLLYCALFFWFNSFPCFSSSDTPKLYAIYPNFSASSLEYLDNNGAFLFSPNQMFLASLSPLESESTPFYFSVIHVSTNTIVWTANRFKPFSRSDKLILTVTGIRITDNSRSLIWSTPLLSSEVSVLQLQDSGNLVLLDRNNESLWQSFDYPTDTIVIGQRLAVGKFLEGPVAGNNLSSGDYRFLVTGDDAVLLWKGRTYWKLSMHIMAYKNDNLQVSFLSINSSGLYLFASDGSTVVYSVKLARADFRLAKVDYHGQFTVSSFVDDQWKLEEFRSTDDICQIPLSCGSPALCSNGFCSCPPGFWLNHQSTGSACLPMDESLSLPSSCDATETDFKLNLITYIKLETGIDYFSNKFAEPDEYGTNLSVCQDQCSRNCSCTGFFHANSTGSCYLLNNNAGSLMSTQTDQMNRLGFIKAIALPNVRPGKSKDRKRKLIHYALGTSSAFILLIVAVMTGFICWRRNRHSGKTTTRVCSMNSSSEMLDIIWIPGLPVKFDYEELVNATDNFKSEIGSGGFGTVYKGILPDKTIVAVKKINNSGINGKREFCGEIATIGSIRHINLVRLKGFSIFGRKRFLVYEYMNKGSLAHALFGHGPVLTWQKRFQIAVGVARGLDYLHNCCANKIIHCDIKPENILLHENMQVKISDFGLSKLLSAEQSNRVTTLRGTRGYMAPEWLTSSRISDRSDVYSYGMVLLELVTGRRNCSLATQHPEEQTAAMKSELNSSVSSSGSESQLVFIPLIALQLHEKRRYMDLLDPKLQGDGIIREVEMLIKVALCCLQREPMLRPTMANVVGILQGEAKVVEPRVEYLNFLRFYGGKLIKSQSSSVS